MLWIGISDKLVDGMKLVAASQRLLHGGEVYTQEIFHPLPLFVLLTPLAAMGLKWGTILLVALSQITLYWVIWELAPRDAAPKVAIIATFCYPWIQHLMLAQVGIFELAGIALLIQGEREDKPGLFGAGMTLCAIFLPNAIPLGILIFWRALQKRGKALWGILIPIGIFAISTILDPTWIYDWIKTVTTPSGEYWNYSLWKLVNRYPWLPLIILFLWGVTWLRRGKLKRMDEGEIQLNVYLWTYLLSPYVTDYRSINPMVLFMGDMSRRGKLKVAGLIPPLATVLVLLALAVEVNLRSEVIYASTVVMYLLTLV
jgi:hypothetical protein